MTNLKEFHCLVGEIIMHCQTIENDIKWIFSAMRLGNIDVNYGKITNLTLGQILSKLKKLDYSDQNHFFSEDDYKFLSQITSKRNYIVHNTYKTFVYSEDNFDSLFSKEYEKVLTFHNSIKKLSEEVERVRFEAIEKYRKNLYFQFVSIIVFIKNIFFPFYIYMRINFSSGYR